MWTFAESFIAVARAAPRLHGLSRNGPAIGRSPDGSPARERAAETFTQSWRVLAEMLTVIGGTMLLTAMWALSRCPGWLFAATKSSQPGPETDSRC